MNRAEIKKRMLVLQHMSKMRPSDHDEYRRLQSLLRDMDATDAEKRIAIEIEQAKKDRAEEKKKEEYNKKQEALQTTF